MRDFQSPDARSSLNFPVFSSSARIPGESAPPITMTLGISSLAFETIAEVAFTTTSMSTGMRKVGMTIVDTSVRRSRSESLSSLA